MNNVDIFFIEPPVYKNNSGERPDKLEGNLPQLGVCSLAAVAERDGYKAAILDAAALQYSLKEVLEEVRAYNPRYVGITSMTHTISSAALFAGLIKERFPDIKILLGGVHITAATEETLMRYPGFFDVCVIGEGETTFSELLRTLDEGGDLATVDGLAFIQDGKVIKTNPRKIIKDMDSLPMPAWHLLPDMTKYYGTTLISAGNKASNHLLTSRGCPGRCTFCDTSVHGNMVRGYSADYVMDMIEILHKKYKVEDIQFNDDTFVTLRKRLSEICERLITKKYNLSWSCDARARDVTKEGLNLMKAAGCWQIAFGVETGSQRILDSMKKNTTFEHIHNAFKWAKKAGISTKGFFIIGHPSETIESVKETVDLMLSLDIDVVGLTFYTVFPGSPIFATISNYGKFNPDWDKTNTYEIGNFIPHGFTAEQLVHLRKQSLTKFYFRPKFIVKQLANIKKPYDLYRLAAGGLKVFSKNVLNS